MTLSHAFELGFVVGLFAWPLVYRTWGQIVAWKWEREFRKAEARFAGCAHERSVLVDVGRGRCDTPKCLDCWGLKLLRDSPNGEAKWTPNCAPPDTPALRSRP